jgi:hypothetical protein
LQIKKLFIILESAVFKGTLMHADPKPPYNHPTDPGLMKEISYPAETIAEAKYARAEERHNSSCQ